MSSYSTTTCSATSLEERFHEIWRPSFGGTHSRRRTSISTGSVVPRSQVAAEPSRDHGQPNDANRRPELSRRSLPTYNSCRCGTWSCAWPSLHVITGCLLSGQRRLPLRGRKADACACGRATTGRTSGLAAWPSESDTERSAENRKWLQHGGDKEEHVAPLAASTESRASPLATNSWRRCRRRAESCRSRPAPRKTMSGSATQHRRPPVELLEHVVRTGGARLDRQPRHSDLRIGLNLVVHFLRRGVLSVEA